jgi:fluoroquinolone transport system permease protein
MTRLLASVVCDIRLQTRNGFYHGAFFVACFWSLALRQLPSERLTLWMPVFILSNILINTFYFMAGLVLLEKAEGTLAGLSVTPLRSWEYLLAKTMTLTLLSVSESLVIVLLGYRAGFAAPQFLLGVMGSATLFSLAGFLFVVRYDSINEFLFPSFLFTLLFVPPFLSYFGLIGNIWTYVHPLQGSLLLTTAAFAAITGWQLVYSCLSSALWIGALLYFSRKAFDRYLVES